MALTVDLAGSTALVTGVSSGIGLGVARSLAESGCRVFGCGRRARDSSGAQAFLDTVTAFGVEAEYRSIDIAEAEAPRKLVEAAVRRFGGLDVVVSNAGRNVFEGVDACDLSAWNACMDLDLRSHWLLAQASKEALRESSRRQTRKAAYIVMTSNHAYATIPGCFPYNVAKNALTALVQSLAVEWGPEIRAVGIAPGFIDTDGNQTWFDSFPDPAAERERTEQRHPVGRIGTVDEIGGLCAFLYSEYAQFINGTTLLIDGGRSALMQDE